MASASKSQEELQKLRVVDLRKELSELALPTSGKKDELVNRLHQHYVSQEEEEAAEETSGDHQLNEEAEPMDHTEEPDSGEQAEILAEPQRLAEEMEEQQRIAKDMEEQKRQAEEQASLAAAEQQRLADEQEALKAAAAQQKILEQQQQEEAMEQQMMLLVKQQQALLDQQKSAHDASQRQSRQLQEQRQQLETALRQNSELQSQNKGNSTILDQLQQQRQQLLAQGEAISSQQSALSEQATTYQDQRQTNEQLMKQVMQQQQLKETEQQKTLLLERQQRLVAEHQQFQIAQQQAMAEQRKNAELLQQQQLALLERQREQETLVQQMQEAKAREQREMEVRIKQEAEMKKQAELKLKQEAVEVMREQQAARVSLQEAQVKTEPSGPPSLLTMDTSPATAGLKLPSSSEDMDSDRKLPKALEDVLALKDIRAKQVGVEDVEQAMTESHSSVTVGRTSIPKQLPLGDVNEYDDDDDDEEESKQSSNTKESKNKKRKKKKKSRAARKAEEKRAAEERLSAAGVVEMKEDDGTTEDSGIEVEYVQEKPLVDITNPLYSQFHKIFETFKIEEPSSSDTQASSTKESSDVVKTDKTSEGDTVGITKRGATLFGELEEDEDGDKKKDAGTLSKKQLKKMTRMSVADLKTVVVRPDLVEMHDVTAPDPKLLLSLKATRNTVPVPRHWCNKRKYLQGKRGFEKPPFELPDYIQATGIMEMRQALADKETDKSMKQKMREKVRPKMGKIDIDYQKLHDAFFKHQRKPKMTVHGDLYYEGKEFETRLREKKPGNLSDDLRTALGMPIGAGADKFPPPWLIAMQRYGPPPSYPNLKIPGLNAPIPDSCSFGYHAGGWGKPPVDEMGKPLYGDVFGQKDEKDAEPINEDTIDKSHWGEMESESEEESESESEEERDDDEMAAGLVTPADAGLITPSGLASIPAGMETPDAIELRKRIEDSMESGGGDTPALYQVLPEKRTSVGAAMMGSSHTYDVGAAKKMTAEGIEVTLNPEELDLDTSAMQAKYEQTVRMQQADIQKEDFSDMVAEHSAKAAKKRKKQAGAEKSSKKHKEFKF